MSPIVPYLQPLSIVYETGEHDDAQDKEKDEKCKLLCRGFESVHENLKASTVSRQLEQPQDTDDAQELYNLRGFAGVVVCRKTVSKISIN